MLAFESAGDLLWRSFPYVAQGAEHERAGRIGAHMKTKRVLPAQDIIDQGPDRMAVARTGEAMRPAPVLQRLRGRPVPARNLVQHLDRRRYPPAFTHEMISAAKTRGAGESKISSSRRKPGPPE